MSAISIVMDCNEMNVGKILRIHCNKNMGQRNVIKIWVKRNVIIKNVGAIYIMKCHNRNMSVILLLNHNVDAVCTMKCHNENIGENINKKCHNKNVSYFLGYFTFLPTALLNITATTCLWLWVPYFLE